MVWLSGQENVILIYVSLTQIPLVPASHESGGFPVLHRPDSTDVSVSAENQLLLTVAVDIPEGVLHGIPEIFIGGIAVFHEVSFIVTHPLNQVAVAVQPGIFFILTLALRFGHGVYHDRFLTLPYFLQLLLECRHVLHRVRLYRIIQRLGDQFHIPPGHDVAGVCPFRTHFADRDVDKGVLPVAQDISVAALVIDDQDVRPVGQSLIPLLNVFAVPDDEIAGAEIGFVVIIIGQHERKFLRRARVGQRCIIGRIEVPALRNSGSLKFHFQAGIFLYHAVKIKNLPQKTGVIALINGGTPCQLQIVFLTDFIDFIQHVRSIGVVAVVLRR